MKQPKGGTVSSVSQLERMPSIVAETAWLGLTELLQECVEAPFYNNQETEFRPELGPSQNS